MPNSTILNPHLYLIINHYKAWLWTRRLLWSDERNVIWWRGQLIPILSSPHLIIWDIQKVMFYKGVWSERVTRFKIHYYFSTSEIINDTFLSHPPCALWLGACPMLSKYLIITIPYYQTYKAPFAVGCFDERNGNNSSHIPPSQDLVIVHRNCHKPNHPYLEKCNHFSVQLTGSKLQYITWFLNPG